jgi:hypothetical protein
MTNEQLAVAWLAGAFVAGVAASSIGVITGVKLQRSAEKDAVADLAKEVFRMIEAAKVVDVKENSDS